MKYALEVGAVEWRKHALERMLQRNISRYEVKDALLYGEIIEVYKDDKPYESALYLHMKSSPLHVVASFDSINRVVYVITAYRPDEVHFENDFKTRRRDADK